MKKISHTDKDGERRNRIVRKYKKNIKQVQQTDGGLFERGTALTAGADTPPAR